MTERALFEHLIWSLKSDLDLLRLPHPEFVEINQPTAIWEQKIFCILSSQFRADRAALIASDIVRSVPFFDDRLTLTELEAACFSFLSDARVRYRFPKSRARYISKSWLSFSPMKYYFNDYLSSFSNERDIRSYICQTFSGVGLKQSSMFLRNIGISTELAVVDVHVLSYLRCFHDWEPVPLNYSRYLEAEDLLRNDAENFSLDLNTFDTLVWCAARSLRRAPIHV